MSYIYLLEYTLCKKNNMQDTFNKVLNNYKNNVKNLHLKIILSCKHFQGNKYFNKHAKFLVTDKLTNTKKLK